MIVCIHACPPSLTETSLGRMRLAQQIIHVRNATASMLESAPQNAGLNLRLGQKDSAMICRLDCCAYVRTHFHRLQFHCQPAANSVAHCEMRNKAQYHEVKAFSDPCLDLSDKFKLFFPISTYFVIYIGWY